MKEEKNTSEQNLAVNELLNRVAEKAGVDDPMLRPSMERWVDHMKRQALLESTFNICVHPFSDETKKSVEELFRLLLDQQLLQARLKLMQHRYRQLQLALRESIDLVDGFEVDTERQAIFPAAMMVGVPNNELSDRMFSQLFRFSMVCLGKEDDAGEIELLTRYHDWAFVANTTAGQYVKDFETLIKNLKNRNDDRGWELIDEILKGEEVANQVAQDDDHAVLKAFALLVIYAKRQGGNGRS